MKIILFCLFFLQVLISLTCAFRKLGDINHASATGSVYLIDKNSLFLRAFTASGPLQFSAATSTGSISIRTSQALSNANMMLALDASVADSFLTAAQIRLTFVSDPSVILSTLSIPNNVAIPCSAEYLGRFQGQHQLDGFAFIDRPGRRFYVLGFNLDGNAPAVYFWLGTSTTPSSSGVIASRAGTFNKLGAYQNAEFIVTPPENSVFSNFRSISVWCKAFSANFGHLVIPVGSYSDSFTCTSYGSFEMGLTPRVHSTSGSVFVTGPQTFSIDNFNTDGNGPAAWFWVGTSDNEHMGFIIDNEVGSSAVLRRYTNEKIVIALPASSNMCNLNFLSVYCVRFTTIFGIVRLSQFSCSGCPNTCVTNNGGTGSLPSFQCLELSEATSSNVRLQYQLDAANSEAHFRITVCNLASENYVAFGLSGSDSAVQMAPDGDPCICRLVNGMPVCQDYSLTSYTQCASPSGTFTGACPDTVQTPAGTDGCLNVGMTQESGATTFSFTRKITSSDTNRDRSFTLNSPQTIIWAKGGTFLSSVNNERWVLRHQPSDRANRASPYTIDLNSTSSCAGDYQCTISNEVITPWKIPPICGDAQIREFRAAIGETGGKQGYSAISGRFGWGIAWYINGYLIPEIYLLRNVEYTFLVSGGDDPLQSATYHPFYITNSSTGGIATKANENHIQIENVHSGIIFDSEGSIEIKVVGPYCHYAEPLSVNPDELSTFEDYAKKLTFICVDSSPPGSFTWTPTSTTPDLVYYQCATHQLLGWKIHIVDSLSQCFSIRESLGYTTTTPDSTTSTSTITTTTSPTTTPATSTSTTTITTSPPTTQATTTTTATSPATTQATTSTTTTATSLATTPDTTSTTTITTSPPTTQATTSTTTTATSPVTAAIATTTTATISSSSSTNSQMILGTKASVINSASSCTLPITLYGVVIAIFIFLLY